MGESGPSVPRGLPEAGGRVPFVEFCRAALYDSAGGYYAAERARVGARPGTDFMTNLAVRSVFAPLVVDAVRSLLGDADLRGFRFVEVGAEPGTSLLADRDHPFREVSLVRLGDPVPALSGPVVLFANEWLDARPFVRMCFEGGRWREVFVAGGEDGVYREERGDPASGDALRLLPDLPAAAPEGYRFDLSVEAESVLGAYLEGGWKGLFLTFDYGSSWEALARHLPGGTARAYRNHRQTDDLLGDPGSKDLTCNVCWDRLAAVLSRHGFRVGGPLRQEAFFLEKSARAVRRIVEAGQDGSARAARSRMLQLLHPAHFGAAFQAFWGIR
ncbi:MAG: SAM-dependent methyltransferase [Puniceicoccaceae bacterium]